jgi:adenosylcobyric acid synthase
MGRSDRTGPCTPLQRVRDDDSSRDEGARRAKVWGTYLHGWFEAPEVRRWIAVEAGFAHYRAYALPWAEKRRTTYAAMADHLSAHVDLASVQRYVGL